MTLAANAGGANAAQPRAFIPRDAPVWVISRLAAPLIGYFFIQSAVSLAGLAVLGRLGDAALAGVGAAGAIYGLVLALMFGVDTGVQAIASRSTGAGRTGQLGQILADAWAIAIPLGAVLGAVLWSMGPAIMTAMLPDRAAAGAGAGYLRAMAPSLVFIAVTLPINACWIGSGRPALAFLVTVLLAPVQIAATVVLVLGAGHLPPLGAAGAGAAISLTTLVGVALQLALALRLRPIPGFLRRPPTARGALSIAALGWPISAQQALLQLGLMIAFVIVGRLGSASTAAINVLISLSTVPIQTAVGLGTAAATLVGQSLGRGEPAQARLWGWRTAFGGVAVTAPLGLIALLAPAQLLSLFLHDPHTLAATLLPARIMGAAVVIDTAGRILCFALRGAGATKLGGGLPFVAQWLIQLPLMWWVGVGLGQGVLGVVLVQAGVAAAEGAVTALVWAGPLWTRARVGPPADAVLDVPGRLARVAILGGAGAGKSTLARRLGALLEAPVIHLDRLVYGPDWTRNPVADFRQRLTESVAADTWVVEGTYAEAADLTLPSADLVIWIDQPAWLRLWRAWRKTRLGRGRPRPDRPDGCAEAFSWGYAAAILRFGRWTPALHDRLRAVAGRPVLRLSGDRAIARFLAGATAMVRPV